LLLDFLKWMSINVVTTLGIALVAAYPPLLRRVTSRRGEYWRDIAATCAMSLFCMQYPWVIGPGQQMDIRLVPLGLVGWRWGTPAAAVVAVVTLVVRYVMGGPGVITSVFYTLAGVALVPLYRRFPRTLFSLAAVGVAQVVAGYGVGMAMVRPAPPGLEYNSPLWLWIIAVQVVGFWLVSAAMEHAKEQKALQRNLADALQSRGAVLELMPHGIVFLDPQGHMTDMNHAARTLFDGDRLPDAVRNHPDVDRALQQHVRVSGCRITLPGRRGCERIVLVSALPLQGGGTVLGIENVTTVVHQEREEARRDRLELLGRMAAMAAHEIRNPLTTIKGFLQLFSGKPEFTAYRSTLSLVQGEVEHINRVVGDFLDLSGNPHAERQAVPLDEVVQGVISAMGLQFPDNQVAVVLEGQPGLVVESNRKALQQVLRNLVANAYEAMPGGGRLVVRCELTQGGSVCLSVIDTGTGVAPDVMGHIFTPYMTTKTTGTGLGLPIAHRLAADMGAELLAESQAGKGCKFRLLLPGPTPEAMVAAGRQPDPQE
jgi:signal transduction histidine kinase